MRDRLRQEYIPYGLTFQARRSRSVFEICKRFVNLMRKFWQESKETLRLCYEFSTQLSHIIKINRMFCKTILLLKANAIISRVFK